MFSCIFLSARSPAAEQIWCTQSGDYEEYYFMGCDAVKFGRNLQILGRSHYLRLQVEE